MRPIRITMLTLLFLSTPSYAQHDSVKNPRFSHRPNVIWYYDIDGLRLRAEQPEGRVYLFGKQRAVSEQIQTSFKFNDNDVSKYKHKEDTTFIQTKLVIILDSLILVKKEEKKNYLSRVDQSKIVSIERLEAEDAIKECGELGKKGVVRIRTKNAQMNPQNIFIYEYFPERGFTTAGLFSELKSIRELNVKKDTLNSDDIRMFQGVMSRSKYERHLQTKTGIGPIFGIATVDSLSIEIVVFSNLIIDMSNYWNYWIENESDKLMLSEFIARIKKHTDE